MSGNRQGFVDGRNAMLAVAGGAAVMVVELGAGRILTPIFGGSIEVWAVVIAMTMLGLAAGYAAGGTLADTLGGRVVARRAALVSAALIAVIPLIRTAVLHPLAHLSTATGSGLACAVLLLPPLVSLGMISPALIRAEATSPAVGRAAGAVYAISTTGSLAGALIAGLWGFPQFSIGTVYAGTAVLLAIVAAVGGTRIDALAVGATLLLSSSALRPTPLPVVQPESGPALQVVAVEPSLHGEVRVVDVGHRRLMLANGVDQGGIDRNTGRSAYGYARSMIGSLRHYRATPPSTALVIGLGPGVLPPELERTGTTVTSIELDPVVADVAREWFGFEGEVRIGDGRRVLSQTNERYDAIFVDAFLSGSPPWHLFTVEAFEMWRDHLTEDGVVVLNIIGHEGDPDQVQALNAVLTTAGQVFPTAEAWPDPNQNRSYPTHNIYVVATASTRLSNKTPYTSRDGRVLTDSSAPLEAMLATTARLVRMRTASYLPPSIRID